MLRRSKPDQIEERRSVSSVWAGESAHGDRRRVETRSACLFLLVQVCLFCNILTFTWLRNILLAVRTEK